MKIYLVRHGETGWNRIHKLQGQSDIELNDVGRELAEVTAEGLKDIDFGLIYSSPLNRAYETALILRRDRQQEILTDKRLLEINFGEGEGGPIPRRDEVTSNPIYNFEFDMDNYIPPKGGETFEEIFERTAEFWDEEIMPLEGKYENILIVGHGCMNRTILNRILNRPLAEFWKIKLDNCAVSVIEVKDGKASIEDEGRLYYSRTDERFKPLPGGPEIYG
jgi:probable phosphoglycerate mutase